MILGSSIHKEQILGSGPRRIYSIIMEKLLELRREYLQEVVARRGGQAREYLEEVAIATSRDLERGECREVEMRDFRAEVDESKRPRKARWGFIIEGS